MWSFTGLNPFNLSIYGLSARCPTLKTIRYRMASKDSLPVAGLPYGTGVSPAKSHDLARPHSKSDPPEAAFLLKILVSYWNDEIFHT